MSTGYKCTPMTTAGGPGRAALRRADRPVHPEPAPVLGYEAQYFGAVEPQRVLALHLHTAIRGAVPRSVVRQGIAATHRQVWRPATGPAALRN